jgi:hypothetical protein
MKCIIVPVIIFITIIMFLGCSAEKAIEKTISDFEDYINEYDQVTRDVSDLKETLSTESHYYLNDEDIRLFVEDYFIGSSYRDVQYSNLDIDIDSRNADVYSDGTYANGFTSTEIWFWMRREEAFFAFISQDWRVYKYHDSINGFDNPIWRKPKK